MLEDGELSGQVIAAAIIVHKQLGPGFLESIYEQVLAIEFEHAKVPFERQKPLPIVYRGRRVSEHRLDFLIASRVVVELKAVQALEEVHVSIVRSYLKAAALQSGLLLNFAAMPLTVKRVGPEAALRIHRSREPVS